MVTALQHKRLSLQTASVYNGVNYLHATVSANRTVANVVQQNCSACCQWANPVAGVCSHQTMSVVLQHAAKLWPAAANLQLVKTWLMTWYEVKWHRESKRGCSTPSGCCRWRATFGVWRWKSLFNTELEQLINAIRICLLVNVAVLHSHVINVIYTVSGKQWYHWTVCSNNCKPAPKLSKMLRSQSDIYLRCPYQICTDPSFHLGDFHFFYELLSQISSFQQGTRWCHPWSHCVFIHK